MSTSLLILVSSDPCRSGRPAEAIRFAAGVGAWRKVSVAVYLSGPAVGCLQQESFEWVDGQHFAQYLPLLTEQNARIYIPAAVSLPEGSVPAQPVTDAELALIAAQTQYVMHF